MFQWYVFLLIAIVAVVARMIGRTKYVNSYGLKEMRYDWLPVLLIVIPLIYWAGTRGDMAFGDTSAYRASFLNQSAEWSAILPALVGEGKDKGFTVVTILLKMFIGNKDVLYFTIIAAISIGLVFGVYKKYSCAFAITAFLFVASTDYIQWSYNGIRQFIAVSICFACIDLIIEKKYTRTIVIILLASTIHASALLMIPMIFIVQGKPWNARTLLFVLAIIIAVAFVDQFTDILTEFMENTQYSGEIDQFVADDGAHVLRVFVYGMPTILSLLFRRRLAKYSNPLIDICINMSTISMAFYVLAVFTSGIFIGRIPIYFSLYNYILLPWIINRVFTKQSAQLIYGIMVGFYLVYYYYQVVISWGL